MESEAVKEARRILRRIQDHLYHAHMNLGALRETIGLVDVLHHPDNRIASLNYITPRRNTAWVSAEMIEQGLSYMRGLDRTPRVQYIEGLFPPLFSKTMLDLRLLPEWEMPLMVYPAQGFNGILPPPLGERRLPEGLKIEQVADQSGVNLWWYVWRNAYYDVLTLGVEPLFVGRDMSATIFGHQVDLLAYREGFPVGVIRLSIYEETAHILGLALMKEARSPAMTRCLFLAALQTALERQCTLIYAPGETETDRSLMRELGFMDLGGIVCYSAKMADAGGTKDDHFLGQPVLALR